MSIRSSVPSGSVPGSVVVAGSVVVPGSLPAPVSLLSAPAPPSAIGSSSPQASASTAHEATRAGQRIMTSAQHPGTGRSNGVGWLGAPAVGDLHVVLPGRVVFAQLPAPDERLAAIRERADVALREPGRVSPQAQRRVVDARLVDAEHAA